MCPSFPFGIPIIAAKRQKGKHNVFPAARVPIGRMNWRWKYTHEQECHCEEPGATIQLHCKFQFILGFITKIYCNYFGNVLYF